jgi:hypothetical protein
MRDILIIKFKCFKMEREVSWESGIVIKVVKF